MSSSLAFSTRASVSHFGCGERRLNMRSFTSTMLGMLSCSLAGAGVALLAQGAMRPGHERVPPYREPSPSMSTAEIPTELSKLDPKLVASRTGGAIDFAKGKARAVVGG